MHLLLNSNTCFTNIKLLNIIIKQILNTNDNSITILAQKGKQIGIFVGLQSIQPPTRMKY